MLRDELIQQDDLPHLRGSRDPMTSQVYFPFRMVAADGSLRVCEPLALSRQGVLITWTRMGKQCFGQIDLPEGVRVQAPLDDGDHRSGDQYVLDVVAGDAAEASWRFKREQ
ncbi:hypothetical protein JUM41_24390 [Rhizobium pusense]|uniref:hypothetical protein n=1 Tax=Agrobacterium pusense TaxID=648995 RepID=UPI001FCCC4F2|nr:hypothetical protein [Agrobacterium pusense]MCJ2877393.1 hypothetical protein [Agrobacterium pusense]